MAKLSKRRKQMAEKLEVGKNYSIEEAVSLISEFASGKFKESIDVSINLGVDTRKSEQVVRGSTILPNGTGKDVRVAVFAQGANADKATGTLLRRLLSNAQSRVTLLDSVNEIERVATKFGGKFNDDLLTQILFVDELDSVFGPVARTSLQGQLVQAIPTTRADLLTKAAGAVEQRVRGINEAGAFRSIKDLLK